MFNSYSLIMKNLKFFLACDMSFHITKKLTQKGFDCIHARTQFLNTIQKQLDFCVSNNLVLVTKCKKLFTICRQIRHPVIWLKSNDNEYIIQERIGNYLLESKILKNAA